MAKSQTISNVEIVSTANVPGPLPMYILLKDNSLAAVIIITRYDQD